VFFNSFGEADELTQSVYSTLVSIEKAMGSGLEHVSISFLPKVIYDIEF
jgi:hypothetical protein